MSRERLQWILVGLTVGIGASVLGVTASQSADLPTGQALVEFREKQLKGAGAAMEYLSQYDGSDADKAKMAAQTVTDVSANMVTWFPEGSGPGGAGIEKTHAKPEIWQNFDDFKAKAKAFNDASSKLTVAAASNDPGQIKPALGEVGQACKACHQSYRAKDKD